MIFNPHKELKKLDAKFGWLCIGFACCVLTFFVLLTSVFFLENGSALRTWLLVVMLFTVIAGTTLGIELDRAQEQRRNLEVQIKYQFIRRKRGF